MNVRIEIPCFSEPDSHHIIFVKDDELSFIELTVVDENVPGDSSNQISIHLKLEELKKAVDKLLL